MSTKRQVVLVGLLFAAALGSAGQDEARPQVRTLVAGKSQTETLSGGESRTYEFTLKAKQFVRLAVTQHHIDTVEALTGSDGAALAESDSLSGYEGTEKISWVAEAAGTYRLTVRSPDKYSSPGTYDLKVEDLRESQANDPTRVRAERLWMDSLKLYQKQSLQAASKNLKELRAAWEQLGDLAGKADTLEMKASIDFQHGALDAALRDFKSVVDLRHQLGDRYREAAALDLTAACYLRSRQPENALSDLQKALALTASLNDELEQARLLTEIGNVQAGLGRKDEANTSFEKALKLYRHADPHTRAIAPLLGMSEQMLAARNPLAQQFYYIPGDYAKRIGLADTYHYDLKAAPEQRKPMGGLAEGKPVTANLLGGESHIYTLPLKSKQFVRLSVTQHHIDTTQLLFGPDGAELAESDSLSEVEGTEKISWVAETPGAYTLEVRSSDKYAAPGAYELKIEELRASQGTDRTRIRAERLWMDSLKLYQKQTDESRRVAVNNVKELLAAWKSLGERAGEADALFLRAAIEFQQGSFDAALKDYAAVSDIRHQLGDGYGEMAALYSAGLCNVKVNRLLNAATDLQKAMAISVALGDQLEGARLLSQTGAFQEALGRKDDAKRTYEQSLELYRRAQAHTRAIAPLLAFTEGLLEQRNPLANQFAQIALDIARKSRDRPDEGRAALLHGRALEILRIYDDSLGDFDEAAQSFLDTSDQRNRASALAGHGRICALAGDYNCAQYWLAQAMPIQSALNDSSGLLESSTTLAEVLNSTGDEQTSLKTLGDLLKRPEALRDKAAQARILNAMGVGQTHLRQYEAARSNLERALALRREVHDRGGEGATLSDLGVLYSEMGRLDQALATLELAMQAFHDVQDRLGAALAQQRGGAVQRKQKNYNAAAESLIRSVDNFEGQRSSDVRPGNMQMVLFSVRVASAENDLASLLAEMATAGKYPIPKRLQGAEDDFANLAFYFSERGRSLELNGILSGGREGGIVRTSVETIQAKHVPLHEHEVFVEYLVQPEQTLVWIIARRHEPAKMLKVPIGRDQLGKLIAQAIPNASSDIRSLAPTNPARPQASSPQQYRKVLAQLYDLLLAPVLNGVPPQTSILVVPDGPLQLIPFEMLGHETPAGWRWAGSDFVFREYASALMLTMWRMDDMGPQGSTLGQQPKPSIEQKLLAFGDPDYSSPQEEAGSDRGRMRSAFEQAGYRFAPLPGTRSEVTGIGKIFALPAGSPDLKLGALASKSALKQLNKNEQLKHYRYLHFATHGILANDVPGVGQPALVLSLRDTGGDGFLTMNEVQDLRIRADLVVLSACRTGLGKQIMGEGTMGMARAFIIAGAPSVVVSLWSVPDESTAKLMQLFYTHLVKEHRDKGMALQMAREELRKQYPNPYYWAPFILIGEK